MKFLNYTPEQILNTAFGTMNPSPFDIIVDKTYSVYIPRSMLHIMDEERFKNDFIIGDSVYDRNHSTMQIPAYITIEHMLNIWDMGFSFRLAHAQDGREVYEVLTQHIRACLAHNQDPIRGAQVDLITLEKMDNFLGDLFPAFRNTIVKDNNSDNDARQRYNRAIGALSRENHDTLTTKEHKPLIGKDRLVSDFEKVVDYGGFGELDDFSDFGGEKWT